MWRGRGQHAYAYAYSDANANANPNANPRALCSGRKRPGHAVDIPSR